MKTLPSRTQSLVIAIFSVFLFSACSPAQRIPFAQPVTYSMVDADNLARFEQPCPDEPIFVDPRDSTFYNTIKIGDQCWMKENLKWLPKISNAKNGSHIEPHYYVYWNYSRKDIDVDEAKENINYDHFGVLYNWEAALTACPPGWKLPGTDDFDKMFSYLTNNYKHINNFNLGRTLRSCFQGRTSVSDSCRTRGLPGWFISDKRNFGTDEFGMSLLPGGYRTITGNYYLAQHAGYWWTNEELSLTHATALTLNNSDWQPDLFMNLGDKSTGASVRCLKSEPTFQLFGSRYEILNKQAYNDWANRYVKLNNRLERSVNIYPYILYVAVWGLLGSAILAEGNDKKGSIIMGGASLGIIFSTAGVISIRERKVFKHSVSIHEQDWIREVHQ